MLRAAVRRGLREMPSIEPRSLALLRIGVGTLLLADLAMRARDLRAHYTDWGLLPRDEVMRWIGPASRVSLYQVSGEAWFAALLFAVSAAFALLLILGYRTRAVTVASWYLLLSLHARNPAVLHGGDNLLRVLLFWAMFLPWETAWSLDRLRRGGRRPDAVTSPWVVAIRLQLCLAYWATAALKWHPPWLGERSALGLAMTLDQFTTGWGQFLKGHPSLLAALTPAVLALELLGPLLVWTPVATGPVRFAVVLLFAGFHLGGIGPAMRLGIFPWVAAVAWLAFLPIWFWERLEDTGAAPRWRRRVDRLLPHLAARAGLPPAKESAEPSAGARRRLLEGVLAAVLVAAVVWMNVANVVADRRGAPPPEPPRAAFLLGLHQSWRMFAPGPGRDDGWYVAPGRLAGGGIVDLWTEEPPQLARPDSISARLGNDRWIKYLSQLNGRRFAGHLPLFARYLCRRWNERHGAESRALEVQILFMFEETLAPNRERAPEPVLLWREPCPGG